MSHLSSQTCSLKDGPTRSIKLPVTDLKLIEVLQPLHHGMVSIQKQENLELYIMNIY